MLLALGLNGTHQFFKKTKPRPYETFCLDRYRYNRHPRLIALKWPEVEMPDAPARRKIEELYRQIMLMEAEN